MNSQQAIDLVQKTFKSAFDRNNYIHFLKNLLNEFDDEGARSNQGARIPDKFQNYVERLERVGKYLVDEHEVMLFIVYLKNNTSIERARTMQRNFVAWYLQDGMKDAALVAFVSKDLEDWRFSFIKMEYRYDEQANKIKEEFTPAKRWSFLVGANETSHTAQRKLVPIMADDDHNPTLAVLEEAFNVEKVTKEFFEKYRGLFVRTKEELDEAVSANPKTRSDFASKGIDTTNLAKKLLGQIIFLFFLQKKGWFGVPRDAAWGEGSRDFLQELFEKKHATYENFFNDILEPLFYDALRRDRSEDDHYYPNFKCKIPFLNGGLFDPMGGYDWVKTDILLSNELFHNQNKTKEGDVGDGILDIFDRYNFTVQEDEPFEKEVAIDPELLGKAYEKFNAIRPDNFDEFLKALKSGKKGDESKFNKQYGVYYTPREIVHYMCQQSLINYLATELEGKVSRDEIAMLILQGESLLEHEARAESNPSKTYQPILSEAIRKYAALIDEKLANIKVCDPAVGSGAFLVGMMSEIVRAREVLRTWTKTKQTTYDFKRHCIEHSLYGVDIDAGAVEIAKLRLWLSLVVDEDDTLARNIKPLPNLDYKIVQGNSLIGVEKNLFNVHLFAELEALKPLYFNATNPNQKKEYKKKIDGLIEQITDGHAQFDFEIYFSEVFHENGGFDIVIANPPYGADLSEEQKKYLKSRHDNISERIRNTFLYFLGEAYKQSKTNGTICFILPNELLFQIYMTKARKFFLENSQILFAINLGGDVFDAIVPTCVIAIAKSKQEDYSIPVADLRDASLDELPKLLSIENFPRTTNKKILAAPNCMFAFDGLKSDLINRLVSSFEPFENFCEDVANGISTSCDEIYIVSKQFAKENNFEKEYLKECIRGGQFNRFYCPEHTNEYVLWVTDEFDSKKGRNIYQYLGKNKKFLIEKSVEKKHGNREWHILFRGRYEGLYIKPKIIFRQTGDRIITAVDRNIGYYCINSVHIGLVKSEHHDKLDYLTGLLNSKLIDFFYQEISQEKGRVLAEVKPQRIRSLPIANANTQQRKAIEKLVERILAAKGVNPQADTSALEGEIDQLVYELYGLSEEEIKIVERK